MAIWQTPSGMGPTQLLSPPSVTVPVVVVWVDMLPPVPPVPVVPDDPPPLQPAQAPMEVSSTVETSQTSGRRIAAHYPPRV
jgi:hypothetical protein